MTFDILGTDVATAPLTPVLGAYDTTETGSSVKVWHVVLTGENVGNISEHRGPSDTLPPQLAQYYHFGFAPDGANNNVRAGLRADTRKSFNGDMAYIYSKISRQAC